MTIPFPRTTPTAVQIDESSLIDLCDLLEADTVEVDASVVTFTKALPTSDRLRWTGRFGEWVVRDGTTWCVVPDVSSPDISTARTWARTA